MGQSRELMQNFCGEGVVLGATNWKIEHGEIGG